MNYPFALLESRFFLNLKEGIETDISTHYEEMRSVIIAYAHGHLDWHQIHIGLSVFIIEITLIIEETVGKQLKNYGRGILELAKTLRRQLELMIAKGVCNVGSIGPKATSDEALIVKKRVTLSAKYTDVCEIINMIISMKMVNGGNVSNSVIINGVHELFGLDYSTNKYYKTRGEIIRRSPPGNERAYFLKAAAQTLNSEYENS